MPKYLNTSATELFNKGNVLFGLHEQRRRLSAGATAVLVEGPLDALAVAAHAVDGQVAAVATDGTAVTNAQVAVPAAAAEPRLVLALDGDQAGRTATLRAAEMMLPLQRPQRVVTLQERQDPASWATSHPSHALTPYLDDAWSRPGLDVVVDARIDAFADRLQWVEGTVDAMRHALRVLDGQPTPTVAEQALRIARRLKLDPLTVADELGEQSKSDRAARRSLEQREIELTGPDADNPAQVGRAHPADLARLATPPVQQRLGRAEPVTHSSWHAPARLPRKQAER